MENKNPVIIKCRGVILNEGKLLIVKHKGTGFYALPGGHIKWPESFVECVEREIMEEFGVKPEIGRLLYVSSFQDPDKNFIEFFFEVKNWKDYLNVNKLGGTHKNELLDILWVDKNTELDILPIKFFQDFKNGGIFSGDVKFIK